MSGKLKYSVVQIGDESRGERLNAAVVIFTAAGLDVRIPKRLEKLRALSNSLNFEHVRDALIALPDLDRAARASGVEAIEDRLALISSMSPFVFSEVSDLVATSVDAYEAWAVKLLRLFVEPEPASVKKVSRRTRLTSLIRQAFKDERILARKDENLSAHRVVSNVPIADGLTADFVLKNGAMHVIETVDATSDVISLRKAVTDIAVSALVLEQARMTFGEKATHSQLIYDASASMEKLAGPSLEAAAHQGAELVNWSSHDDRRRLLAQMAMLAEPLPMKRRDKIIGIHASTQGRFKLN